MTDTDELLNYLQEQPNIEVDHAIIVYLEPNRNVTYRETKKVRDMGYKIQNIESPKDKRTKLTLVREE